MTLEPLRIGILHSTTGTMALNETSLRDVVLMEVARVNAEGGLLGRPLEPIALDPASDWMRYRDMAHQLVHEHGAEVIFGCWTSVSRKSVLPVIEQADRLLFYPLQYEGEEQSSNVFYLGATPNQQALPAVEYLMSAAGGAFSRFFFLGNDYVYPRTTNAVLRSFLQARGLPVADFPEHYVPFGHQDWSEQMAALHRFRATGRGAVISTINGDANLGFYRALRQAGLDADKLPVMALSVSEAELQWLDPEDVAGHLACWDYFMSDPAPENQAHIEAWRRYAGDGRPLFAPMVAAMLGFRMWCQAVQSAGTPATAAVRQYMLGRTVSSPGGGSATMGLNHHMAMRAGVGRANRQRQFDILWRSPQPIAGDPWAAGRIIADATAAHAQRDLLDALPTPLLVIDEGGALRYRSDNTHEYFGSEITPSQLATLRTFVQQFESAAASRAELLPPEISVADPSGRPRHMTVAVRRMVFAGSPAHLLSLADVTALREVEAQLRVLNTELQRLATTDALTGIANRRHFMEAVTAYLRQMQRHPRPAVMFVLDLDHFKALNDRHGHGLGDEALVQAAQAVQQRLRGHDVFARVGGEEFAGLLIETDLGGGLQVAERLRQGVQALRLRVNDDSIGVTCSIGVTAVLSPTDTPESALKRADDALYAAKHGGRNRVCSA